jgi:6-phosphogluconate dehydrogenase
MSVFCVPAAAAVGVPVPGMTASLGYFDTYRRERLPANMVQVRTQVPAAVTASSRLS